jgi:hypothetical protein
LNRQPPPTFTEPTIPARPVGLQQPRCLVPIIMARALPTSTVNHRVLLGNNVTLSSVPLRSPRPFLGLKLHEDTV